jgi:hypothetical protein
MSEISQVLYNQIEFLLSQNRQTFVYRGKLTKELKSVYFSVFGKFLPCETCEEHVLNALDKLQLFLNSYNSNQKPMEKIEKKECGFKLKPGSVLGIFGGATHVTEANLTDDLAYMLLERTPKNARHFTTMPKDWEAELEKRKAAKAKKPKGDKKQESGTTETMIVAVDQADPGEEQSLEARVSAITAQIDARKASIKQNTPKAEKSRLNEEIAALGAMVEALNTPPGE